jgi:exodeoxyribonuclease V beta subunit
VPQILVCTYTHAATRELRDRIRARITKAGDALALGTCDDPAAQIALTQAASDELARVLHMALERFDEAQIFTIHSFCSRILAEHAFESASTFDAELLADSGPLVDQVIRDFIRRKLLPHALCAAAFAADGSLREDIARLLGARGPHRDLQLLPIAAAPDLDRLEARLSNAFTGIAELWCAQRDAILAQISDDTMVSKKLWNDAAELAAALDHACECRLPHGGAVSAIRRLCQDSILAMVLKRAKRSPEHPFFDACSRFCELLDKGRLGILRLCLESAPNSSTPARGPERLELRRPAASGSPGGGGRGSPFARAVAGRYRAALIDEFQDTDPLQWRIFESLCRRGRAPLPPHRRPQAGDLPLRGADVHAYLDAAARADRVLTLGTNWRSDAPLARRRERVVLRAT